MGVPPGDKRPVFRSSSAPSIPRADQCFGYEEVGDGRLLRNRPKHAAATLSGKGLETAGPGHYEHQGVEPRKKAAPNWSFAKGHARVPLGIDAKETPGPGHYIAKAEKRA